MDRSSPADSTLTPFLVDLLDRWAAGSITPSEVMGAAHARWEAGSWPNLADDDPDNTPITVLELLAEGRANGILAEDVPALLAMLRSPGGVWVQINELYGSVDLDARERLMASGYYGPGTEADEPHWEIGIRDAEDRRLHKGVREDPESVWPDVRARMCNDSGHPIAILDDILDDLLSFHADAFVDRVLEAARDCSEAKQLVVSLYVGGSASDALDRFEHERRRMEDELVAAGELTVWRAGDPELDAASELLAAQADPSEVLAWPDDGSPRPVV
jgi:hypothetical protein